MICRSLLAKSSFSLSFFTKKKLIGHSNHQGHGQYRVRIGNEPSIVLVGCSYIEGKQRSNRCRPLCGDAFTYMHSDSHWDVPPHLCYRVVVCYRIHMCIYRAYISAHVFTYTDACKMTANLDRIPEVFTFESVRSENIAVL